MGVPVGRAGDAGPGVEVATAEGLDLVDQGLAGQAVLHGLELALEVLLVGQEDVPGLQVAVGFSRTARRYSSQHTATAAARPMPVPISGATVEADASTAVQMNRVVSRPSRLTAKNAVRVRAPAPSDRV